MGTGEFLPGNTNYVKPAPPLASNTRPRPPQRGFVQVGIAPQFQDQTGGKMLGSMHVYRYRWVKLTTSRLWARYVTGPDPINAIPSPQICFSKFHDGAAEPAFASPISRVYP